MRLYKLKQLLFVQPNYYHFFNVVDAQQAINIEEMEEGAKLQVCKEIFSSLDFVNLDALSWRFDDVEQRVYLVGKCTQDEKTRISIIHKDTLKLLCTAIGYEMRMQLTIEN